MFELKRPCVDCPFRKGVGSRFRLHHGRLQEIADANAFQCHKTVDYSEWTAQPGDKPQQCAGLMAVLHRSERPNQLMQVATRLRALDPALLDPRNEAYETWAQVLQAHRGVEPS